MTKKAIIFVVSSCVNRQKGASGAFAYDFEGACFIHELPIGGFFWNPVNLIGSNRILFV